MSTLVGLPPGILVDVVLLRSLEKDDRYREGSRLIV